VYLVGAGPGDLGLLTLRGRALLRRCDVVIYDGLVNPDLLRFVRPGAERVEIGPPHDAGRLSQEEVCRLMVRRARQGRRVVRLKGGDPFIFGRGGEEAQALVRAGVEWKVVPGVSAGHAAPAYAGIPLTHRGHASSVAFVTGHECGAKASVDWHALAKAADTLVVFMGAGNLPRIVPALREAGRPDHTPVAAIEQGTWLGQRVRVASLGTILGLLEGDPLQTPALLVVGDVAALHAELAWFGGARGEAARVLSGVP
jgi:uroporphyrin-III C-methyltransferase